MLLTIVMIVLKSSLDKEKPKMRLKMEQKIKPPKSVEHFTDIVSVTD